MAFQIKDYKDYVILLGSGVHNSSSHLQSRAKYLSNTQKTALKLATKCAPTETPRQIRRNMENLLEDQHIAHDLFRSVQRVVHAQKAETHSARLHGVKMDGTNGKMTAFADKIDLLRALERHNDPNDPYHLDMHEVVSLGAQFEGGVKYLAFSTAGLLMNLGRQIQSEWEVQLQSDGSFNHCSADFGLIAYGVNSLRCKCRIVSYSIVPSEHHNAFIASFNGVEKGFFGLCNMTLCPSDKQCSMCEEVRDIVTDEGVQQAIKDQKLPIRKASCDNSTSFAKFVRKKLRAARLLQCSAHLTGTLF